VWAAAAVPKLTMRLDGGHPPRIDRGGSIRSGGPAMMFVVTDNPWPADLGHIRATMERTHAVGRRFIGRHVHEARDLATRSRCQLLVLDDVDCRREPSFPAR